MLVEAPLREIILHIGSIAVPDTHFLLIERPRFVNNDMNAEAYVAYRNRHVFFASPPSHSSQDCQVKERIILAATVYGSSRGNVRWSWDQSRAQLS
jgi:hypothetical protein